MIEDFRMPGTQWRVFVDMSAVVQAMDADDGTRILITYMNGSHLALDVALDDFVRRWKIAKAQP